MSPGQQNSTLSLSALFQQAHDSQPLFDETGARILATLRDENPALFTAIAFENGGIKSLARATAKIAGDYGGDHSKITDLTRGRIVVDTPEQVEALRAYIDTHRESLGVETMKDRFANPSDTHFRDINMKLRLPNGHVAELRVEHRGLLEAARHTHEPYEQIQEIERRATLEDRPLSVAETHRRQDLLDRIRDIHDDIAVPAGFNDLLNEDGLTKLTAHALDRAPLEPLYHEPVRFPALPQPTAPEDLGAVFRAATVPDIRLPPEPARPRAEPAPAQNTAAATL